MSDIPVLPGITSTMVDTPRLRQHVLTCGAQGDEAIVFIHGNFSAATYWEELMLALHGRGYPSIGCEPCTRAIRAHEDLRAGRWWWESAANKECGLHVRAPSSQDAAPEGSLA